MAASQDSLSRPLRIGMLGAASAIGAHGARFIVDDGYIGATVGGAVAAIVANQVLSKFSGIASVALIGAISGYAGRTLSERLAPDPAPDGEVPFRALLGLILGGGVGAISADGIFPPEIKLLTELS